MVDLKKKWHISPPKSVNKIYIFELMFVYCFRWFLLWLLLVLLLLFSILLHVEPFIATRSATIQTNWCYLCVCVHVREKYIDAHATHKRNDRTNYYCQICIFIESDRSRSHSISNGSILSFFTLPSLFIVSLVNAHFDSNVGQSVGYGIWMCHISQFSGLLKIALTTATVINS